jgi:tripartite-type tricarboxylate transporter receptor subunit TctC
MPAARAIVSSRLRATAFLGLALLPALAFAQAADPGAFPQRTDRIIAAQQAGSATDKVARIVADSLARPVETAGGRR